MFGNKKNAGEDFPVQKDGLNSRNQIGMGTRIIGTVECDNNIRLDGFLKGSLKSKAKVVIGASGRIEGDVSCINADVEGHITGTLIVQEVLYLQKTAKVNGDVYTKKLVVDSGAVLNGKVSMDEKGQPDLDASKGKANEAAASNQKKSSR